MDTADENKIIVEVYNKLVEAEQQIQEGKVFGGESSLKSIREKYNV